MPAESSRDDPARAAPEVVLPRSALLLDLEVTPLGRPLKIGAVLGDQKYARAGPGLSAAVWLELAEFSRRATCLIGHNLTRHDLPILAEHSPGHPLLALPVIDTLTLSPLAFPENPYHRLVKDYKLVRESVNDPVADARAAGELFADEIQAFTGLRETAPELFGTLRFLLTTADHGPDLAARGFERFFAELDSGTPGARSPIRADDLPGLTPVLLADRACRAVRLDEALVRHSADRLALAYALVWLRVAGGKSVLPPWVRWQYPQTTALIREWREKPCLEPECAYCTEFHDPRRQLRHYFNLPDFRPQPTAPDGGSLQRAVVMAGMRDESLLAILPTGGGKSLCFQLPALIRNRRRGVLTIVISPLQALMKDQVDGLGQKTGGDFAAALYGLLTPLERAAVLQRVRLGDIAILYVSPEQLRNRSFTAAIAAREIGCWVFDEAHCLSKWGHDFRPDYLYAGRYVREQSKAGGTIPPVACFTATAREDVKAEILGYFRTELGLELRRFEGGVERDNLDFEVQPVVGHAKMERVHEVLSELHPPAQSGCAVVFRATREATEDTARYLAEKGWVAAHFHAGLTAPKKKEIQDQFIGGNLRVICATNAFGMGIDKDDVRLVIHADIPGSLENYLQEAGRAGRDGRKARCVLLYDAADCERQFRLGALSELTRPEIAQILRGLRRATKPGRDQIVVTTGEILRDEEVAAGLGWDDNGADTKVRTAVAWLERSGFLRRDENVNQVFQARLLFRTLAEAEAWIQPLQLPERERSLWLAILRALLQAQPENSGDAAPARSITVDELALLPELRTRFADGPKPETPAAVSKLILARLRGMTQAGLLRNSTQLDAYVRYQVQDHSRLRLDRAITLERLLLDVLQVEEPDPEGWQSLNLRFLNERLCADWRWAPGSATEKPTGNSLNDRPRAQEAVDEKPAAAEPPISAERIRTLLRSLAEDWRALGDSQANLELRPLGRDHYRVRVRRGWRPIVELADKRRRVARIILDILFRKIPAAAAPRADVLIAFDYEELHQALGRDLALRSELKNFDAALERALLYLHEQRVIILQKGLAVFRAAMTITLAPEAKGKRYTNGEFEPLHHHYLERRLQVHVMGEYAQRGLRAVADALVLVREYFRLGKQEFIRRYLPQKPELLVHATTAQSFQRIVTELENQTQIAIVTAPLGTNLLVLAGPGSGKTRTLVHRCAYLLRVERVRPRGVLVCCFNRRAALELRRRLVDLVGDDARGILVLTYHGLAMRLLGRSFSGSPSSDSSGPVAPDFDSWIQDAVKLLRGERDCAGLETDEIRDRLLAGFQHILIDEYQDIDEPQYQLISAIAGRTLEHADEKLSVFAVGDDDQNIYSFRGANVRFIRQFQADYAADIRYLIENYRATRYLIEASNHWIAANRDRMKRDHPIRIDRLREMHPPGGEFGRRDPVGRGRVAVVALAQPADQPPAVLAELGRLRKMVEVHDWSDVAVLAGTHRALAQVRSALEGVGVPFQWWPGNDSVPVAQVREVLQVVRHLKTHGPGLVRASTFLMELAGIFPEDPGNPWVEFARSILADWRDETGDAEMPCAEAVEFFHESCWENRRGIRTGRGVILSTIHAAKGTEHRHVVLLHERADGNRPDDLEEQRRVTYVGLTRAQDSLVILEAPAMARSPQAIADNPAIWRRNAAVVPAAAVESPVGYRVLGLAEIDLGFAGRQRPDHPIHAALAALQPGARVSLRSENGGIGIYDTAEQCVGRLARKAETVWKGQLGSIREVRVLALIRRGIEQDDVIERRERYLVPEWEVPVLEAVVRTDA